MILVTGGAGFIGSNLINELIKTNLKIVLCDYKSEIRKSYFRNLDKIFEIIEPQVLEKYI